MLDTITQIGTILVGISPLVIKQFSIERKIKTLMIHVMGDQDDRKTIQHFFKVQELMLAETPKEILDPATLKSNGFISHFKYCIDLDLKDPTIYSMIEKKIWALHRNCRFTIEKHIGKEITDLYYTVQDKNTELYLENIKKILLGAENDKKQRFIECSVQFMIKFLEDFKIVYENFLQNKTV